MIARRSFIAGAATALLVPAVVRAESLMRVAPTEVIRSSARFDTRVLVHYDIMSDSLLMRVDRSLGRLVRPPGVVEATLEEAQRVFGANHPIFSEQPDPGVQRFSVTQLRQEHGYLGAAAVLGRNPVVSRRFFGGGVREEGSVASPGSSSSDPSRRNTNQETVA